jgi:hypothetical protein
VTKVIYFGTLINHKQFHGNKKFLTFMQSVLPIGNAKLKTLIIKTNKMFTYCFECVWNLGTILSVGVSSNEFGNRDNFVWTPNLHICSNIHLSPHLVTNVVTTFTQLRRLFHCYHNEKFLYVISQPWVPLDAVCITLELLVARYQTNQSPHHARERTILSLKIRTN